MSNPFAAPVEKWFVHSVYFLLSWTILLQNVFEKYIKHIASNICFSLLLLFLLDIKKNIKKNNYIEDEITLLLC